MRRCVMVLWLGILLVSTTAWAYSGGSGTPTDPYQIATYDDLVALGQTPADYDKCFVLTADIECPSLNPARETSSDALIAPCSVAYQEYFDGVSFVVFAESLAFTGRFDGNGYVIRNLNIFGSGAHGLFGVVGDGAWIGHLGLEDVWLKGSNGVGALAVSVQSACIEDCYSTGKIQVTNSSMIGGLIGYCDDTRISDCNSSCEIEGKDYVGGLVGQVRSGYVFRCSTNGDVQGQDLTGGLIGYVEEDASVMQCHSSATVKGNGSVGGLVGDILRGLLLECDSSGVVQGDHAVGGLVGGSADLYYDYGQERGLGDVTGCTSSAQVSGNQWIGGLIGYSKAGVVVWCHAIGPVTGQDSVGGLVGFNDAGAVRFCYSMGSVSGQTKVGGLVGNNGSSGSSFDNDITGLVDNCYTTASVDGNDRVGGLVGDNGWCAIISYCYSIGQVQGQGVTGGLAGRADPRYVADSFWDVQRSGMQMSAGGTGLPTSLMSDPETFQDNQWDFVGETANGWQDLWKMPADGGPPVLVAYPQAEDVTLVGQGTRDDPYRITTASQLLAMRIHPMACYRLDQDIDLSGLSFSTALIPWFAGTLDGQGHAIQSMHIEGSGNLGLFGQLYKDTFINDVRLLRVNIVASVVHSDPSQGGSSRSGSRSKATISATMSSNSDEIVQGKAYYGSGVGGLAGRNQGHIQGCCVAGTVTGMSVVGGLLGLNQGIVISCYSQGSAYAEKRGVGGLVGVNEGWIADCYSKDVVDGGTLVAGLVADNVYGSIQDCYCVGTRLVAQNSDTTSSSFYSFSRIGQIRDCFWEVQSFGGGGTSGNGQSIWSKWEVPNIGGTGPGSSQLHDVSQLKTSDWDFSGESAHGTADYWDANETGIYPTLRIFRDPNVLAAGQGTEDHPWILKTVADLGRVWQHPYGHYQLGADIDCNAITWGKAVVPWFSGIFDGNGCSIKNLKLVGARRLGLFGILETGADVSHLQLTHVDVNGIDQVSTPSTSLGNWTGISDNSNKTTPFIYIAGRPDWLNQPGAFTTSSAVGFYHDTVSTPSVLNVGALAGVNRGNIHDVTSTGMICGNKCVGGLVGLNKKTISRCGTRVAVQGEDYVGGLIGSNLGGIDQSFSFGSVNGDHYVGGLLGLHEQGIITDSYSNASVDGNDQDTYGFVGKQNGGTIQRCCYTGLSDVGFGPWWNSEIEDCPENAIQARKQATLLSMGWDFVGETANGTEDTWVMLPGYGPRLAWEGIDPNQRYSGGSGTVHDPYRIATVDDLLFLSDYDVDWDKHFILTADVDLAGLVWQQAVIAPAHSTDKYGQPNWFSYYFQGSFDGNGHVIRNLAIKGNGGLGLFGFIEGGSVYSLGLENVDISGSGNEMGALGAYVYSGVIAQCYSTGKIEGEGDVGGLVGYMNNDVRMMNCYSATTVSGGYYTGSLVGDNEGDMQCCYGTGPVHMHILISNGSSNTEEITYDTYWQRQSSNFEPFHDGNDVTVMTDIQTYLAAGWDFVGEANNGLNDFWQMPAGGGFPVLSIFQQNHTFGLSGSGTAEDPYTISTPAELGAIWQKPNAYYNLDADLDLAGMTWRNAVIPEFGGVLNGQGHVIHNLSIVGDENLGLFGELLSGAQVNRLGVVDVNISGQMEWECSISRRGRSVSGTDVNDCGWVMVSGQYCGALAGKNSGSISNCFATGSIEGLYNLGGLVSQNEGNLVDCYSAVQLSGGSGVSGLAGNSGGNITGCFWDTEVSSISASGGGTGLTTAQMQDVNTYLNAGWNFGFNSKRGEDPLGIWTMPETPGYPVLRSVTGGVE